MDRCSNVPDMCALSQANYSATSQSFRGLDIYPALKPHHQSLISKADSGRGDPRVLRDGPRELRGVRGERGDRPPLTVEEPGLLANQKPV
mmetsp:Transcript_84597/g.147275  ORF Transcript_84597/g.147275 Transcript_84597/m.147275 type:complete len:90 (+) Transcript_84597:9-278(+)